MAYPDLYKDESKILEAQNIKVKSVPFDAILTTRRLILIDRKKPQAPPQEVLLATLKNVDSGENAIRDPTITISIITSTGSTRQMILTFSKTSGGERKREADEWVKILRQNVSQTIEHPVLPDIPGLDNEEPIQIPVSTPPVSPASKIEIVNAPPQKKRIEISRPIKKVVESVPAMPKPVETTTLPTGTFCNRCGSRVPPESAFCNRCGTPVVTDSDLEAALRQPVPPAPAPAPEPVVPQVAVPIPPVIAGHPTEKKERPIEEVIHSIEPLIEDSVPRTAPAPLVQKPQPAPVTQAEPEIPAEKISAEDTGVQWPVITPAPEVPVQPAPPQPPVPQQPAASSAPAPVPPPVKRKRKPGFIAVAVLAVIIIAVVAGIFLFANPLQPADTGTVVATPVPTTIAAPVTTTPSQTPAPVTTMTTDVPATAVATPAVSIPPQGVWIRVTYPNRYAGTVGTPGSERDVSDTGDQFYQISTSTGTVVASIRKVDGSAEELVVELYKDGELVTRKSTIAPKGLVELQVSLKPSPTPTTIPVTTTPAPAETGTPAVNATANETAVQ